MVERLLDEVVGAGFDGRGALLIAAGRDHDDRQQLCGWLRSQPATHFVAVEAWHDHVQEHQVRRLGRHHAQSLLAGGRGHQVVAARPQHRLEQPDVLGRVVDQQELWTPLFRHAQGSRWCPARGGAAD